MKTRKRLGTVLTTIAALALLVGSAGAAPPGAAKPDPGGRVNVNTASAAELAGLPGIGPSKAQAIVEHRAREPFKAPEDLRKVKGIGDKLYESLRDQITVGDAGSGSGRGS